MASSLGDLETFDFSAGSRGPAWRPPEPDDAYHRKLKMLRHIDLACRMCQNCELGMNQANFGMVAYDPHVFSNMRPHRFAIYGSNPGRDELAAGEPFVGASGQTLRAALAEYEFNYDEFYVGNVVRCHTPSNRRPELRHLERCDPFLALELRTVKPKLVLALGATAVQALCPEVPFLDALGKLNDGRHGTKVIGALHPSPLNLADEGSRAEFSRQVGLFCRLVRRLGPSPPASSDRP